MLKCKGTANCVHPTEVCDGRKQCILGDDELASVTLMKMRHALANMNSSVTLMKMRHALANANV